jgi:hypothetical protein
LRLRWTQGLGVAGRMMSKKSSNDNMGY